MKYVLYCGHQSIVSTPGNGGKFEGKDNFIAFLKLLGEHSEILRKYLNCHAMNNATYLFPDIKNELINFTKMHLVLISIISEVKKPQSWLVSQHHRTMKYVLPLLMGINM